MSLPEGRPGRGRRRRWISLVAAAAAAVAGAAMVLFSRWTRPEVLSRESAHQAFALASGLRSAVGEDARSRHVARAAPTARKGQAPAKKAKASKASASKGRYRGVVSPKLRNFLEADEYERFIVILASLEERGLLSNFVDKAEAYFKSVNFFQLAAQEQQGGGRKVLNSIRKDWARIWPEVAEDERKDAYDAFCRFFERLDRARLIDTVMKEVLPDMNKQYEDILASKDHKKLMAMNEEERRDEFFKRLGNCDLIKQYAALSNTNPNVQLIGPKMGPFIARMISLLDIKVAEQTESLAKGADAVLIGGVAIVVLVILAATGIVKIPDPTFPNTS